MTHKADVNLLNKVGRSALIIASNSLQRKPEQIRMLLNYGAQINLQDKLGQSALILASKCGNINVVQLLLNAGATVDLQDSEGKNALNWVMANYSGVRSIEFVFYKVAELLLRDKTDVNLVDNEGVSALMRACENGSFRIVKLLLSNKANVNLQDKSQNSALTYLCRREVSSQVTIQVHEIAKLMLTFGADVNLLNETGKSALMIAIEKESIAISELLIQRAQLDLQDNSGQSALMIASNNGNVTATERLLNAGAKVDLQDKDGQTALILASYNYGRSRVGVNTFVLTDADDCYKVAKLLLKRKADVKLVDSEGKSALMVACKNGCLKTANRLLLLKEIEVNVLDKYQKSALMYLCGSNFDDIKWIKIAEKLLNHKAKVNLQDEAGRSALMIASEGGWPERVAILLKNGAQVDMVESQSRQSALMIACKQGHADTAKLLLKRGAQVDLKDYEGKTALILASKDYLIQLLLKNKAQIDMQDNLGQTALMIACKNGDNESAKLLIHSGAQVNLQDSEGRTALILASRDDDSGIIDLLLDHAANVDMQDNSGESALLIASKFGNIKVVEMFLYSGAQVDLQDKNGNSALMIASAHGFFGVSELLLKHGAKVDLQNNEGRTALIRASCTHENKNNIELLINYRAEVDMQDHSGRSALMTAGKHASVHAVKLLLNRRAQVDLQDKEGKTALSIASDEWEKRFIDSEGDQNDMDQKTTDQRFREVVGLLLNKCQENRVLITECCRALDLLLKGSANIDFQDDNGYSALMTASESGCVPITSRLLDEHADTFLKNREGKTAFDIVLERNNVEQLSLFTKLRSKPSYPGILFSEGTKRATITATETNIDLEEVGISLSIPENSLSSTEPPVKLEVQPCFSGPFVLPEDVELVSPVYIVKPSRRVTFQKEVLVKIWHHANLETEGDCEDMVFLSADTSPEYRGDTPVYVFKKIRGAKGSFRPGEEQPVGHIALKHFCLTTVGKNRKRKRRKEEDEDEGTKSKQIKGISNSSYIKCVTISLVYMQAISTLQDCTELLKGD